MPGHLALVGYMGSGKTTVGRLLADRTGRELVDLDREVVRRAGRSIPEIFTAEGEDFFRDLEGAELRRALARARAGVVACGGGVVLRPANRAALRGAAARGATTVFLRGDVDTLYSRTRGAGRPLRAGSREDFARRYAERLPLYREVADLEIVCDGRPASGVAEEIMGCLPMS